MIAQIEQDDGTFVDEKRTPKCEQDFCDRCRECLHCYREDPCFDGTEDLKDHVWVIYQ